MDEKIKQFLKLLAKKIGRAIKAALIPILIAIVIIVLISSAVYFITVDDGTYKEDDWSSPPYAAAEYNASTTVNSDGTITAGKTSQEIWDEMEKNNSRVDQYLDTPKQLAKLMNAEIVTKYPDTRSNPDEPIDWESIDLEGDRLQGIIKFKRSDKDGNTSTLTYVDQNTFNGWIKEYNNSGDETAKQNALSHFTIQKGRSATRVIANGPELCWPVDGTTITSYFGLRDAPTAGASTDHGAIDIGASVGDNVYACEAGTVTIAGWSDSAGNWVVIDHGNGYVSKYMHNSELKVSAGDVVSKGQVIALAGSTGISTGPHCHFQIEYNGEKIDPLQFKYNNGMGNGTGGFGTDSSDTADKNKSEESTRDEADKDSSTNDEAKKKKVTDTGVAIKVNGDGYSEEYTSSAGITYKDYKQYEGSYASNKYWEGTISTDGCGPTSLSIIASGITTFDYTPADIAAEMQSKFGYTGSDVLRQQMESMGMSAEIISSPSGEDIKNYLMDGKVMLVCAKPGIFTTCGHWMAVVDINTKGEVYLCNPGSSSLYGWYDADFLANELGNIIITDAGAAGVASSLKGNQYSVAVATWEQEDITVTTDDPNVDKVNKTKYKMTTTQINYQELVDKYTMPFDFLWALLVVGESKDFIMELADLAYNSDIEITVYDNYRKNTDVDKWTYTKKDRVKGSGTLKDTNYNNTETVQSFKQIDDYNYTTTKTVVTQTNTLQVDLTKADTWIVEYTREYTHGDTETNTETNTDKQDDTEWKEASEQPDPKTYSHPNITAAENKLKEKAKQQSKDASQSSNNDPHNGKVNIVRNLKLEKDSRYVNIKGDITNTVETTNYQAGSPETKEKTDPQTKVPEDELKPNFVTIFKKSKYSRNKSNILSASSWLFEILETNESTADMVDLVKYLLYKATGNKYGVTEFDFSIFDASSFSLVGDLSGSASTDLIGFLEAAEGGGSYIKGDKYEVYYTSADGCLNVGHGVVVKFKNGSIPYPDLLPNPYQGQMISKEVYMKMFNRVLENKAKNLDTALAKYNVQLEKHKYDAMVSYCYNC